MYNVSVIRGMRNSIYFLWLYLPFIETCTILV